MVNEPGKLAGAQRAREKEKGAGQFAVPQREEEENYEKLLDQYGARKFAEGEVMKGMVLKITDTDVIVDIGYKSEGVIPVTQFIDPNGRLTIKVGDIIDVLLEDTEDMEGHIVLSRKLVLENEHARKKAFTLEVLRKDAEVRGIVKNITDYGVFVDLGGIDGLLHVTDLSWGRVNHPSEMFNVGDEITVKILKYDREKERVSLGYKQLTPDH